MAVGPSETDSGESPEEEPEEEADEGTADSSSVDEPNGGYQLPRSVFPIHYRLFIFPNAATSRFLGHVAVTLRPERDCPALVFNALGIVAFLRTVVIIGEDVHPISRLSMDPDRETATAALPVPLRAGTTVTLIITYVGQILTQEGRGFYASSYKGPGVDPQQFLCTYFEPTDARRLFPCWDEPVFRATFEITVACDASLVAVSNSPVQGSKPLDDLSVPPFIEPPTPVPRTTIADLLALALPEDGEAPRFAVPSHPLRLIQFATTPVMCTYLVALVVGPLHHLEAVLPSGVPIRVYVPSAVPVQWGTFVLDLAARAVPFWEQFFDFPFPLPKIDFVGIPELAALGMENVGCQVFNLDYLLVNETTDLRRRQRIVRLVGHEVSHQWFGNIVSIEWWSHLWLKEGFARYLEFLFVDHVFPKWDYWMYFLGEIYHTVLLLDMDPSRTHPVERDVQKPREVLKIFDAISYEKGATIIRMLLTYLGPDRTSSAMHAYVQRYSYQNVNSTALWQAIEAVAGEEGTDITAAIQHWLSTPGHPLVTIEVVRKEAHSWTYEVTQRRVPAPCPRSTADEESDSGPYWIPLRMLVLPPGDRAEQGSVSSVVLDQEACTFTAPADATVKVNHGHWAVCRVSYSEELWERVIASYGRLEGADRLGLCIDAVTLCLDAPAAGVPLTRLLDLLAAARDSKEEHPMVWSILGRAVGRLLALSATTPWHAPLVRFLRRCYGHILPRCSPTQRWDAADYSVEALDPETCGALLTNLLHMGDDATLAPLAGIFRRLRADPVVSGMAKELLVPIFQAAALQRGEGPEEADVVDWLLATAQSPSTSPEILEASVLALASVHCRRSEIVSFFLTADVPPAVLSDAVQYLLLNPPLWADLLAEAMDVLEVASPSQAATTDRARHWLWWLLLSSEYCGDLRTCRTVTRVATQYLASSRLNGMLGFSAASCNNVHANSSTMIAYLDAALSP